MQDISEVNFLIFCKDFSGESSKLGWLLCFFNWFFAKQLKTVRTINLNFVWSKLYLISVRAQDVLPFATTAEVFVNTTHGLFNANSLFILSSFHYRLLKSCIANIVVAKQNALGSISPPRSAISNSVLCSLDDRFPVTSGVVLLEISISLQEEHFLWLSILRAM